MTKALGTSLGFGQKMVLQTIFLRNDTILPINDWFKNIFQNKIQENVIYHTITKLNLWFYTHYLSFYTKLSIFLELEPGSITPKYTQMLFIPLESQKCQRSITESCYTKTLLETSNTQIFVSTTKVFSRWISCQGSKQQRWQVAVPGGVTQTMLLRWLP